MFEVPWWYVCLYINSDSLNGKTDNVSITIYLSLIALRVLHGQRKTTWA